MRGKPKKNRLFALPYSLENVNFAAGFRFSRVTPDYILLYTERARLKPPDGKAAEVKKEDLHRLTARDEAWLLDCGVSLFAESAAAAKGEQMDKLSDMIGRLEAELEAQRQREGSEEA